MNSETEYEAIGRRRRRGTGDATAGANKILQEDGFFLILENASGNLLLEF